MTYSSKGISAFSAERQPACSTRSCDAGSCDAVAVVSTLAANPLGQQSPATYMLLGVSAIAAYAQFLHYSLSPLIR